MTSSGDVPVSNAKVCDDCQRMLVPSAHIEIVVPVPATCIRTTRRWTASVSRTPAVRLMLTRWSRRAP